jgi:hypothetical protein
MSIEVSLPNGYCKMEVGGKLYELYPGCHIRFEQDSVLLKNLPGEANSCDIRDLLEPLHVQVGIIRIQH